MLSDERELVTTLWDKIDNLKSDLADSQAEVELERGLNVGNLEDRRYDRKRLVEMEKKLFASQAEVERLQAQAETLARLSEIPIFSSHDRDGVIE